MSSTCSQMSCIFIQNISLKFDMRCLSSQSGLRCFPCKLRMHGHASFPHVDIWTGMTEGTVISTSVSSETHIYCLDGSHLPSSSWLFLRDQAQSKRTHRIFSEQKPYRRFKGVCVSESDSKISFGCTRGCSSQIRVQSTRRSVMNRNPYSFK